MTAVLIAAVLLLGGCAGNTVYPVTLGSHVQLAREDYDKLPPRIYVVLGNHDGAVSALIHRFMAKPGTRVIERARLAELLNEQRMRLIYSAENEADLMKLGRMAGANRMVFVDAHADPIQQSGGYYSPQYGGGYSSVTVFNCRVAVRGVDIETGEILWSGSAWYPSPINNPEQGIVILTNAAVSRATCRTEWGYAWDDMSGCRKPAEK